MGMCFMTIAMQNERSGFITLVGYINLVYGFLGDVFIFEEQLRLIELLGIVIVLLMNIAVIYRKISAEKD